MNNKEKRGFILAYIWVKRQNNWTNKKIKQILISMSFPKGYLNRHL